MLIRIGTGPLLRPDSRKFSRKFNIQDLTPHSLDLTSYSLQDLTPHSLILYSFSSLPSGFPFCRESCKV